jgi:hypothetical protein
MNGLGHPILEVHHSMIWLRRFLAVNLSILFLPIFVAALLLLRVNGTVLSADFYVDQVRQADIFNFLYDEAIPSAVDDMGPVGIGGVVVDLRDLAGRGTVVFKEFLPPEWVQEQVETVIRQGVPYVAGSTDEFRVPLPVADRVDALGKSISREVEQGDAYALLFDDVITPILTQQLAGYEDTETGKLPLGISIASADVVVAVQAVLPPEWVRDTVDNNVAQIVPYLTGENDHFTLNVPVEDRVKAMVPAIKVLLLEAGAYGLLFDEVVVTLVEDNLSQMVELPFGIAFTSDEIVTLMREVMPPDFVQAQAEAMLDEVVPWLVGDASGFTLVVPLADRKDAVIQVIRDIADEKLRELADDLPPCTLDQVLDLAQSGFGGEAPLCRPDGFSLDDIKQSFGITLPGLTVEEVEALVGFDLGLVMEGISLDSLQEEFGLDFLGDLDGLVGNALPDEYVYTDVDLRDTLGPDDEQTLDDALAWIQTGVAYTDDNLRNNLASQGGGTFSLDAVLGWMRDGFTDADLRDLLTGEAQAGDALDQFDMARGWLGLARSLWFLLPVMLGLWLASIGFLGGRSWRSRVAWAAVPLSLAAAIVFVASGPAFNVVALPLVDDRVADLTGDATGIAELMADKVVEIGRTLVTDIISGLANRSLIILIIGLSAVAATILWPTLSRMVGRGPRAGEEAAPGSPESEQDRERGSVV